MVRVRLLVGVWGWIGILGVTAAPGGEPESVLSVRVVHPERQLERVLGLFEGSPWPDPASALAAWRRATGDQVPLTKPVQAGIAIFNAEMVPELEGLDGTTFNLRLDAGQPRWRCLIPHDTGAIAALGPALSLTLGAIDAPLGEATVDRLGAPGSPLMARIGERTVVLASDRDELARALDADAPASATTLPEEGGVVFRFRTAALGDNGPLDRRRLSAFFQSIGCREVVATAALQGDAMTMQVVSRFQEPLRDAAQVEPDWLDWVPSDRVGAAFAIAFEPGTASWDGLFGVADRVEKADPARADTPPVRLRMNLFASAAGIRLDRPFWPRVRGLTAWVRADGKGGVAGGFVALHATGPDAARDLAEQFVRPLSEVVKRMTGHPLDWSVRGPTVAVGWGQDALESALAAVEHRAERSAGPALAATWTERPPQRFGTLWPGRLMPPQTPLIGGLDSPSTITWYGSNQTGDGHDVIRWERLRASVRRALDRIPR